MVGISWFAVRFFSLLPLLTILFGPALALVEFAEAAQPALKSEAMDRQPLRNYVGREGINRINIGEELGDILFEVIDDRELADFDVGGVDVEVEINRDVYEAVPGTDHWTVVDEFRLKGTLPILGGDIEFDEVEMGVGKGFGFYMGLRGNMVFQNVRQVAPKNFHLLPSPEERKHHLEDSGLLQMVQGKVDPEVGGVWVKGYEPSDSQQFSLLAQGDSANNTSFFPWPWEDNTENRARFGRLLNLLFHPFRIPFKADKVSRLDDGEIISYMTRGSIEFGPSVGWNIDLSQIVGNASIRASVGVFLAGQYQISILKEDNRYVRVKAARLGQAGLSGHAQAKIKSDVLEGIFLIEKAGDLLEIVPFKFSTAKVVGKQFAVTYRYDLENQHAREAFEKAVLGQMKMSDQLAHDDEGNPSDFLRSGVKKIETRMTDSDSSHRGRDLELSLIIRRKGNINRNDIATVITTPDGTRHFFESTVSASTRNQILWMREKMDFHYSLNLDMDKYDNNPADPLAMRMFLKGKIEDSHTYREEMMSYILMAEDTVGKVGVFPRPPHRDAENKSFAFAELPSDQLPDGVTFDSFNTLGRSRIEFELNLDNSQLNRIIDTADNDMWRHLESGFNVEEGDWSSPESRSTWRLKNSGLWLLNLPLFLADVRIRNGAILEHAERVKAKWERIKRMYTGKERAEGLAKLFYDRIYHYDIIRMIRSVLANDDTYYYSGAYTRLFGRVNREGITRLKSGDFASETQKRIDRVRREESTDDTADVSRLRFERLENGVWKLSFDLNVEPQGLYVQLQNDKKWYDLFKPERVDDALAYNHGQLQRGHNEILMDPTDKAGLYHGIVENLKPGKNYVIKASVNPDGLGFGRKFPYQFSVPKR